MIAMNSWNLKKQKKLVRRITLLFLYFICFDLFLHQEFIYDAGLEKILFLGTFRPANIL